MKCEKCGKETHTEQDVCFNCHLLTCDSCFCECPAKQIAWRKANWIERILLEEPCGHWDVKNWREC